ncbi:MAG: hypothetical protein MUF10_01345 [Thermoanaerobaculaceae bacterium]|jgi:hypothetical protein|nr:hypothetical protein [Thermoanaerobaculaceae bacterium]
MPVPLSFCRSHPGVVGMVHVHALPGTPHHREPMAAILDHAREEARILAEAGFDALLVENMHDVPYLNRAVGPEITAAMTRLGGGPAYLLACAQRDGWTLICMVMVIQTLTFWPSFIAGR